MQCDPNSHELWESDSTTHPQTDMLGEVEVDVLVIGAWIYGTVPGAPSRGERRARHPAAVRN